MTTTATTFWKLIEDHSIEIPKIQRDYTYGRDDLKVKQIRKVFIEKLIKHLKSNTPLHLDFVYGKLAGLTNVQQAMENRRAIGGLLKSVFSYAETLNIKLEYAISDTRNAAGAPITTLLPLDGQQRLTTLFLLHWYISSRIGKAPAILGRFTYNTRKNAKDFCSELVKKGTIEKETQDIEQSLANNEWFFAGWKKDPTVKSMLIVLNEIHNNLGNEPEDVMAEMWHKLTIQDVITFSFLDTQQLLMTDELYVKMNARGKQLTDYENMKAWLQETHTKLLVTMWEEKLDTVWTDLFWFYREPAEFEIDDAYYKFFKEMALNQYAVNTTVVGGNLTEEQIEVVNILRGEDFIPHSYLEDKKLFAEPVLIDAFCFLSLLENEGYNRLTRLLTRNLNGEQLQDIVKILFGSKAIPKLWDRVFIFAITRFVINTGIAVTDYDSNCDIQFKRWVRVASNLIYNKTIDSPTLLLQALNAIHKMTPYSNDIYLQIVDDSNRIPFFDKSQVDEERKKCKLIISDPNWESLLEKYEQHSYFYAQVSFLLELATINSVTDIHQFAYYAERAAVIFSDDILLRDDFLMQRALLAHHEYLIEVNNNTHSLILSDHGTLRLREENWRQYFRQVRHMPNFKDFLNKIDPQSTVHSLQQIIANSDAEGWRKLIIDHPKVISYCKDRRLQWPNKIDRPNWVMVLGSTKRSGYHVELYSYCFLMDFANRFFKNFAPLKLKYEYVKGGNMPPYAYVGSWQIEDIELYIGIYFYGESYQLCVFDNDDQPLDTLTVGMLTSRGYTLKQSYYILDIADAENTYLELEELCTFFNNRLSSLLVEQTDVTEINT